MPGAKIVDGERRSDSELATGVIEVAESLSPYLPKGKDVLDVGCGYGYFTGILLGRANRVVGIDISQKAITHCIQKFGSKAKFMHCGILQFKTSRKFDYVLLVNVLDQIEDDILVLRKINSLLGKDGRLLISTPVSDVRYIRASKHRYSADEMEKKIAQAGFAVEEHAYRGGILAFCAKFLSEKIGFPKWLLTALRSMPFYRQLIRADAMAAVKKDTLILVCKKSG